MFEAPSRREAAPLAALLVALALSLPAAGCSFSWGGGDSPEGGDDGAAIEIEETKAGPLRKVAILPAAYVAEDGGYACDLCDPPVSMKPTSREAARLVTGFFHEQIARHPRFLFPTHDVVEAVSGSGMRQAAASLAAAGKADSVVVAALVELRQRVGTDDAPESPAGATIFAALVDARSGKTLWSKTYDGQQKGRGGMRRTVARIAGSKPFRWGTAEEFSETAVAELVEDLNDFVEDQN